MATTRFISKDSVRIIDEHSDGRNFFYFQDRRADGYAIRRANGTSFFADAGADYITGNTEADKPLSHVDIIDGGQMAAARRRRWDRIMMLEWLAWPGVQAIEATWTSENNNRKKEAIMGIFMTFGVSKVDAQTIADAYIPGGTKPTQANMGNTLKMLPALRDWSDESDQDGTDDLGVEIEAHRTGRRSKDIVRAFKDMLQLRQAANGGWDRIELEINYDGFMRASLGRGAPETAWEWKSFHGDEDQVTRDISNVADKMYQCAKAANDEP